MTKNENATDLDILNPDQVIRINGEEITVHEYRYMEGLRVTQLASGLLDDLTALFLDHPDCATDLQELERVFAVNAAELPDLIAMATGQTREWVESLNDQDGQRLQQMWWIANAQFFMRRLVGAAATRLGQKQAAALVGDTSQLN